MNILEEINQTAFNSSIEKALVNILYTYNWLRDKTQDNYKPYGIRMQHYNVLRILKGKYPEATSPGEIKEVMLDKSPDLTRLLDKLVAMAWVERDICSANRRKIDVKITKKGLKILEELTTLQKKLYAEFNKNLSPAEAESLSDLLDKLRN